MYDRASIEFECTCGKPRLMGMLCEHFLVVYESDDRLLHHIYMWHPRWFRDPAREFSTTSIQVQHESSRRVDDVPAALSAVIIARSKELLGPYKLDQFSTRMIASRSSSASIQAKLNLSKLTKARAIIEKMDEDGDHKNLVAMGTELDELIKKVFVRISSHDHLQSPSSLVKLGSMVSWLLKLR